MNEPLQAYMQVGIVHCMAYPQAQRGEQVLATLRELAEDEFFQAVEVTHIPDPAERRAAAQLLAQAGMVVAYAAQPVQLMNKLDIGSADPAERQRAVARLKACIDEAYELGAVRLALMSGPNVPPAEREAAIERTVASIVELCEYSRSQGGMPLCLETFDYDIDKKALIGPNALAAQVSAAVRRHAPDFGLMVDLSHLPLQHESIADGLAAVRGHLVHAHIGNCVLRDPQHPLYGDQHPRFGHPAGENGVPELTAFLRGLLEIGYLQKGQPRGVAFEVKPAPGEDSRAVVAGAKRALLAAWALV